MSLGTVRDVMDIIQRGYGDSSMTPLDRTVATNIINYLQSAGWMGPEEVAHIVQAAGGEVRISEKQLDEGPKALSIFRDQVSFELVLRSIDTSKAKVNPDAESRTVQSGPVNVKPANKAAHHPYP
jgi:hypothetical protein